MVFTIEELSYTGFQKHPYSDRMHIARDQDGVSITISINFIAIELYDGTKRQMDPDF